MLIQKHGKDQKILPLLYFKIKKWVMVRMRHSPQFRSSHQFVFLLHSRQRTWRSTARTIVPLSFEERTEYYERKTWAMYRLILNYRTKHRILNYKTRRHSSTTRTTKHSSTSSLRRNEDLRIEENQDMSQRSMLAAAIDQDACLQSMEEIFDLEMQKIELDW